jgi:drug/metabolite transporter (DMT)-like permease
MNFTGELFALLTAIFWTGSSLAFAASSRRIGSIYVNVARLLFASMILGAIVLLAGLSQSISTRQLLLLIVSGQIGLVFGDTFLFKSYEYQSARISSLLMSAAPAMSVALSYWLVGETLSWTALLGIGVTLGGIVLVLLGQSEHEQSTYPKSKKGILYALVGALGQAGGLVVAKMAFQESSVNGFFATFLRVSSATIVIVPLMITAGRISKPVGVFGADQKALRSTMLGAVFGPILGISCSLFAIEHTSVGVASTIMATVPLFMLPAVVYLYKEKLSWESIIGAVVAVAGVGMLFIR